MRTASKTKAALKGAPVKNLKKLLEKRAVLHRARKEEEKVPRKWSKRVLSIRAIRKAQRKLNDHRSCVPYASMRRLVINQLRDTNNANMRISEDTITALRDVTDHIVHEILKQARRDTEKSSNPTKTISGKGVQFAAASFCNANPMRNGEFLTRYIHVRSAMGLPAMATFTDSDEGMRLDSIRAEYGSLLHQDEEEAVAGKKGVKKPKPVPAPPVEEETEDDIEEEKEEEKEENTAGEIDEVHDSKEPKEEEKVVEESVNAVDEQEDEQEDEGYSFF